MTKEEVSEYKKGLWTVEEDKILMDYVRSHGKGQWNRIAKKTGLKRCGKSCRLRWMNYLSPGVKKGNFTEQEEDLIIRLHKLLGNRWSLIAKRVPGRTDNQVKNYWNTHLSRKFGFKQQNGKAVESSLTNCCTVPEEKTACSLEPGEPNRGESGILETDHSNRSDQRAFFSDDVQAAVLPVMEESNYVASLWFPNQDDFELSSLTMVDFMGDYCF